MSPSPFGSRKDHDDAFVVALAPATESDGARLTDMVQDLYREDGVHSIDPTHILQTLAYLQQHPEAGCLYIVVASGACPPTAAGYAILVNWWSNEHGGRAALLDELYLLPQFRGKGLGTRVMDALDAICRGEGVPVMYLEVEGGNRRAIRLYEARGFAVSPRIHMLRTL